MARKVAKSHRSAVEAGGYVYEYKRTLALLAATEGFTHYVSVEAQLDYALRRAGECSSEFLAKTAIYSRERGYMKDMPAFLCAVLASKDVALLSKIFPRVIDNGEVLRNFVQIMRSGVTGRKSLGTRPKKLVQDWLNNRDARALFFDSVGSSTSISDVIKMTHPRPINEARNALFQYLTGKVVDSPELLPDCVKEYQAFRESGGLVPDAPFQMLASLPLNTPQWIELALNSSWTQAFTHINTFQRHGVFNNRQVTELFAEKLSNSETVRTAKALPYQLMTAYRSTPEAPLEIRAALHSAMENATENAPKIAGDVVVCVDVSRSMDAPAGYDGQPTATRCIDVAALIAVSLIQQNPRTRVLPFNMQTLPFEPVSPQDSVTGTASRLIRLLHGGTDIGAPLTSLLAGKTFPDTVIIVSDNQSRVQMENTGRFGAEKCWKRLRKKSPKTRLVCIDVQGLTTAQVLNDNVLNVGGFSDAVFDMIGDFAAGGADTWVNAIEAIDLS